MGCATRARFAMARLPTLLIGALALARGLPTAPDGTLVPFDGAGEARLAYFWWLGAAQPTPK